MILLASCNRDVEKVIPRGKMSKIYAEMLVTDQWILTTPSVRRIADTSLVYEPILEKYGFDSDDYRKSVDKYMDDPERFARILREAGELLNAKIKELEKEQQRLLALARLPKVKYVFTMEELAPCMTDEAYTHYYDSLSIISDSSDLAFRIISIDRRTDNLDSLKMDSLKTNSQMIDTLKIDTLKFKHEALPEKEPLKIDAREIMTPVLM